MYLKNADLYINSVTIENSIMSYNRLSTDKTILAVLILMQSSLTADNLVMTNSLIQTMYISSYIQLKTSITKSTFKNITCKLCSGGALY